MVQTTLHGASAVDGEHAELRHARYLHEDVGAEQFLLEIGDFGAVFVARGASDEVKPRDETFELEDSAHVHRGFGGGGALSIGGAAILPLALRDVSFDLTAKQTFVHLVRVVRAEIRSHEQKLCEARNLKVQTSPRATSGGVSTHRPFTAPQRERRRTQRHRQSRVHV